MRRFELSDEAHELAEEFIVGHTCTVLASGISYEFTETSIGTMIHVKCGCGESEDITDYAEW